MQRSCTVCLLTTGKMKDEKTIMQSPWCHSAFTKKEDQSIFFWEITRDKWFKEIEINDALNWFCLSTKICLCSCAWSKKLKRFVGMLEGNILLAQCFLKKKSIRKSAASGATGIDSILSCYQEHNLNVES